MAFVNIFAHPIILRRKRRGIQPAEIQDNVAYFEVFGKGKIVWPIIGKLPRFTWDSTGAYVKDTGFVLVPDTLSTLSILQSRAIWFALSQYATPLRLRAGLWQYQSKVQFIERLPIPTLTAEQESGLAGLAEQITALSRQRYQMHESMRQTISGEFGGGQAIGSQVTLYEWWALEDDKALSDELKRLFKREIPLGKRAEWRGFLADEQAKHAQMTGEIVALEMRLNAIVYEAFGLTAEERDLIERTTKYGYGEV
jgi:hypothetical protein